MLCGVNDDARTVRGVRVVASVLDHGCPGAEVRSCAVFSDADRQAKIGFRPENASFSLISTRVGASGLMQKRRQGDGNGAGNSAAEQVDDSGMSGGGSRRSGAESFPEGAGALHAHPL
jgi:hypothetical protein